MINLLSILSIFLDLDFDVDDMFDDGITPPTTSFFIIFALAFIIIIASVIVIAIRKHKNSSTYTNPVNTVSSNVQQNHERDKKEELYCEYCGGMIPENKSECPYCGAKRKKK